MHEHPFFVLVVINLELFKFCAVNIPKFDEVAIDVLVTDSDTGFVGDKYRLKDHPIWLYTFESSSDTAYVWFRLEGSRYNLFYIEPGETFQAEIHLKLKTKLSIP